LKETRSCRDDGSLTVSFLSSASQQVAENKGDDAKDLLEKTYKDIEEILKKRVGEAEKLANEAKKDVKKEASK